VPQDMARHFDRETRRVCRMLDARVQGSGRVSAATHDDEAALQRGPIRHRPCESLAS
jgi:hypothetical protein